MSAVIWKILGKKNVQQHKFWYGNRYAETDIREVKLRV